MGNLYLGYNNQAQQDGYFAQLQRKITICFIARVLKSRFYETKISDVWVQQLDNFQNSGDLSNYLTVMNAIYQHPTQVPTTGFHSQITLGAPTLPELLILKIKSFILNRNILALIANPYGCYEKKYFPRITKSFVKKLNFKIKDIDQDPSLVIHIRRGVTLSHIVPGEKASRVLNEAYFERLISKIISENSSINLKLVILTDAPEQTFIYSPVQKDKEKWELEFVNQKTSDGVKIEGHSFQNLINFFPGEVKIIRGGDPQAAIEEMIKAKFFIMSRSSMSYVGALLNKNGAIYYPPNFWHKPLKNWIKCS